MKRLLLMMVGLMVLAAGSASAADLPRQMPVRAPAYFAPPPYNWTGFYVGINGGGGWGTSKWDAAPVSFDVSGGVVGGTVGYNWQFGTWVAGVEGDLDWSNIKGSSTAGAFCGSAACETRNSYLSTVRGRVGYAFDRFLPYVTGGLAVGNIKASSPGLTSVDDTNAGWTAGAGVEFAVAGNVTAKVEYLYVDLGNITCGVGTACINGGVGNKVDFTTNMVRGGLNFRF